MHIEKTQVGEHTAMGYRQTIKNNFFMDQGEKCSLSVHGQEKALTKIT